MPFRRQQQESTVFAFADVSTLFSFLPLFKIKILENWFILAFCHTLYAETNIRREMQAAQTERKMESEVRLECKVSWGKKQKTKLELKSLIAQKKVQFCISILSNF